MRAAKLNFRYAQASIQCLEVRIGCEEDRRMLGTGFGDT